MKRVVSLSSLALILAACGGPTTGDVSVEEASTSADVAALERGYGDIADGDERPLFDDDRVRDEDRRDRDVPMDTRPSDEVDPTRGVVILSIRYGNLDEDRTRDSARWRFRVNATGGVFLRGHVYAEDDEDTQLAREDRGIVTWHSSTPAGDHDGARFAIAYPADARGLGIETGDLTIGIPLEELVDFERLYRTENGHVYVRAHRAVRDGGDVDTQCRGGTIRARATGLNDNGVGEIHGVVRNRNGDPLGHIRGRYGVRNNGHRVFFAKIINRNGNLIGRVRGTFERSDRESIEVRARLHVRSTDAVGVVHGRIINREDQRGGVFLARWAFDCDDSMPRDRLPEENDRQERDRADRD